MTGSAARRHCQSCNKQVHNLAALTPSQIEQLVNFSDGNLCGQIARGLDGAIITAPEFNRPALAGLAFAASLSLTSIAAAQAPAPPQAVVTGTVVPAANGLSHGPFMIAVTHAGVAKAMIHTESDGSWRYELPPGTYDFTVFGGINGGILAVEDVALHPGEQSFGIMQTRQRTIDTTTGGALVIRRNFLQVVAYRLRHPIAYIAYLSKRSS